jgi:hypothetical protein
MSNNKSGLVNLDILMIKSLADLKEVVDKAKFEQQLKEENQLFDRFIKTGKVKPIPKPANPTSNFTCTSSQLGSQRGRKLTSLKPKPHPHRKNHK